MHLFARRFPFVFLRQCFRVLHRFLRVRFPHRFALGRLLSVFRWVEHSFAHLVDDFVRSLAEAFRADSVGHLAQKRHAVFAFGALLLVGVVRGRRLFYSRHFNGFPIEDDVERSVEVFLPPDDGIGCCCDAKPKKVVGGDYCEEAEEAEGSTKAHRSFVFFARWCRRRPPLQSKNKSNAVRL